MDASEKTLKTLPHSPGVYQYLDIHKTIIYIGKARDLYTRIHQYFAPTSSLPEKTRQLVQQIHSIKTIQVGTEFEALLLEAKLIRTHSPKYNSIAKDDKSPIYIHIQSKDDLPLVLLTRKPKVNEKGTEQNYFGPFTSRKIALTILRTLRHSIPFCQQKIRNNKPCFYTHLGLCHPCPSEIVGMPDGQIKQKAITHYMMNIHRLQWILSGRTKKAIRSLEQHMRLLSKNQKFEEAGKIRDQIHALLTSINTHYDPFLFEETDMLEKAPGDQIQKLKDALLPSIPDLPTLHRIECFDMSTHHGTSSGGSMVVFEDGIPHTDQYRKFQIKTKTEKSDVKMMEEVITRRLGHPEWTYPDLVIVDGGKPQVATISALFQREHVTIPLIGLSKRFEQIIVKNKNGFQTITLELSNPGLQLLQHIRDEAHRFAISYHKKLRNRAFSIPT